VEEVQAAEKLMETLWGKDLKVILAEALIENSTWKYVPEHWMKHLGISALGYRGQGLLIRPEYDIALGMEMFNREKSIQKHYRGIVVTGQPGIGVLSSLIIVELPLKCASRQNIFSFLPAVLPVEQKDTRGSSTI
jgi:hypothetical protein